MLDCPVESEGGDEEEEEPGGNDASDERERLHDVPRLGRSRHADQDDGQKLGGRGRKEVSKKKEFFH